MLKSELLAYEIQKFKIYDGEEEKTNKQYVNFKFKCEDFWKRSNDPRRDDLYYKMHPMIFLKE